MKMMMMMVTMMVNVCDDDCYLVMKVISLWMGKYGTKLDFCTSKKAQCIVQPLVHSLSAELVLTLGSLQLPPIL